MLGFGLGLGRWSMCSHLRSRLPRTVRGKLDTYMLAIPPLDTAAKKSEYEPLTPVEQALAGYWRTVLCADRVDLDDSFFALGGYSLSALRLVTMVRNEMGIAMSLDVVFDRPALRTMAATLEGTNV